ncbi:MAG: hypothetical protein ACYC7A_03285 [Thermoanaerobaculia bacterium]
MARGWESKSVESQKQDKKEKQPKRGKPTADFTERTAKRESLELSRRRIVRELAEATAPVRKASLQHALRFLDDELKKLDGK